MPALELQLHISADELLALYRGEVRTVRGRATTGQTVEFPASALRRHVSTLGVHGRFRMEFDAKHKFISLDRVVG